MAKQTINPGTAPTGAGGDTFRSGSAKLQANDDELYAQLGATAQGVLPAALPVNKGGTGATTAAAARTNLGLGTAATRAVGTSAGNVMEVGAFGLGGFAKISSSLLPPNGVGGFHSWTGKEASDSTGVTSYQMALNIPWVDGSHSFQLISGLSNTKVFGYRRWGVSGGYGTFRTIRTSENTTVDSNGFIKSASPIVELYADRIELNDEAKQQQITFEKLGVGDYLIKNSSGFAQEGWYIETPKDANGNVLFSVIYTTLENGDISVKTYKKKFDLETASIVADLAQPMDITTNRWIDIRLQELPQPEIEVIDEPEQ